MRTKYTRLKNVFQTKGINGLLKSISGRIFKSNIFLQSPYDYVQSDTLHNLHRYLKIEQGEINSVVMVGAHMAHEVHQLRKSCKNCRFVLFEASPRYGNLLSQQFSNFENVVVEQKAVSDVIGSIKFYETNLAGSGSTQRLGDLAVSSFGAAPAESYDVASTTLDSYFSFMNEKDKIDCLWIDVQGAELRVLKGGDSVLGRVSSVFIEVSLHEPLYEGGAVYDDLAHFLGSHGFKVVSLGTDFMNGTGNALFLKARN